jgi:hypothetical protein
MATREALSSRNPTTSRAVLLLPIRQPSLVYLVEVNAPELFRHPRGYRPNRNFDASAASITPLALSRRGSGDSQGASIVTLPILPGVVTTV